MSKRPWMPLYAGDYIKNTMHLSTDQHGAYLLLILHYWECERLPEDDSQLALITRQSLRKWLKMKPILQAFFHDGWKHRRIESELTEAARISMQTSAAGKASAESRKRQNTKEINEGTPTPVEPALNKRSSGTGNEMPTPSHSPSHSQVDVVGGEPTVQPCVPAWQQTSGYDLAKQIASIAGQAEQFEMTGWGGASRRAQHWLDAGWQKDLVIEAVRQMMRTKRDGPPISIKYFEKGIAKHLAQQNDPLPNVVQLKPQEIQVVHGKAIQRPREPWQKRRDERFEALAEFRARIAALEQEDAEGGEGGTVVIRDNPAAADGRPEIVHDDGGNGILRIPGERNDAGG